MTSNTRFLEDSADYLDAMSRTPLIFPTAVNIELTTYCNLECIMCPKTSGYARTPPNRTIQPEILDRILTSVVPSVARIDLVGDGEIMVVPNHLEKILRTARQHQVLVNASTNGILMSDKIARMLVEYGLHDLNFSMDAATADTYFKIRKAGFEKLLGNIRQLNRIKSELNSAVPYLHFSMVGMKMNIHELPDLVTLAHELNVENVTLQAMGEFEPVSDQSVFLRDRDLGRKYIALARDRGESLGVHVDLWPEGQFDEMNPGVSGQTTTTRDLRKDCYFPWDVPYFATDGSVRACCALPPLGDLNRSSFDEIWNGKAYTELRKSIHSNNPPKACRTCPGRGWYLPELPQPFLIPGRNDRQLGTGWFELEFEGETPFRWARESSVFFVSGNQRVLSVDLQHPSEIHEDPLVSLRINRSCEIPIKLSPGRRETFYFKMPRDEREIHTVFLKGRSWQPLNAIPGSRDPRKLTFKFFGARLQGHPIESQFDGAGTLFAADVPSRISHYDNSFTATLYWDSIRVPDRDLFIFLHVYPSKKRNRTWSYFIRDVSRRFGFSTRFQSDVAFSLPESHQGLLPFRISVPIPAGTKPGLYSLWTGLYVSNGSRIKCSSLHTDVRRNSVRIGNIEITK